MKVQVNDIPIRHNGETFAAGDVFDLTDSEHEGLAPHVTVVEADSESELKHVDDMTVAELKAFAVQAGIDLGEATKKDDILAAIKAAQ